MLSSNDVSPNNRGNVQIETSQRENSQIQTEIFGPVKTSKRLIVDHIVLENFKSYAGRQVIGPFHENFTSIVGPNGSGKSNVIDAFMFVLGYRAKKLRQGRLSELIHNSEGLLNLESCTVEVHFKLISNDSEVPIESICISRTAYRNNSNKYYINEHVSNYIEVTTLLRDFGVDLDHKRFLILQGEVESIAQMKPKASNEHEEGLLEYLEDIIGTNKYIEMIEESGNLVDKANDLCAEKIVRVKSAEKDVQALLEEKTQAENFIRKENNLIIKKAEMFQWSKFQSEQKIEKLKNKLQEAKKLLKEETQLNTEKCFELSEIERKLKDLVDLKTKHEAQVSSALKKLSGLEKDDIKLQETRKHLKTKSKNLSKNLTDETKNRNNVIKKILDNEVEIGVIGETIKQLQKELALEETELTNATQALKGKTGDLQEQLEQLQKQLSPWTEKICVEQDGLEGAVLALTAFEKKQRASRNEQSEVEKQLTAIESEHTEAQRNKNNLQEQKENLKTEIVRIESEIVAGEEIQKGLVTSINTIQATLTEANEALRQGNSGSAALSALIKESSAGRIKGVHGRLGDLGIIDSKYDIAISTACSSLNYIVVDDTAGGQKCVEFLRKNNLGRASFIILEKMRNQNHNQNIPTGAQRLFDLIQVKDTKFLPAFYFALNDTLVAGNMEEASKLAYGGSRRFRVVTIDGKLIDTSGTMSGGGGNLQQGGMKASFTPEITREQLTELNSILTQKLSEQKAVKTGLNRFQELLSKCKIDLKRVEMEIGKGEIALKSLSHQILDLQDSLKAIKAKDWKPSKEDLEKIDRLKAQVLQNESNIQELTNSSKPIQNSIEICQNQILEAGGTRFKAQRSKVNDLKDQLKLQEKQVSKLLSQKLANEKEISQSQTKFEEKEISEIEKEISETELKIENVTIEAFKVKQEIDSLQKESEIFKENFNNFKEEEEKIEKDLKKFRKKEIEFKGEIEKFEVEISNLKKTITWCEESISKLEINSIQIENEMTPEIPNLNLKFKLEIKGDSDNNDGKNYDGNNNIIDNTNHNNDNHNHNNINNNHNHNNINNNHNHNNINIPNLNILQKNIKMLEEELGEMRPNLKVIQEYRERATIFESLKAELMEIKKNRDENRFNYENLRKRRHDEFMSGFRQISLRLKELYQLITMGGNAELELVDSLDPFTEGILFSVMPPKKSWKNISNLSGGEKTLSSLALVFALHTFKPTPIYVMDEIDAALDFRNVSIVANYLKERTKDAQFIVISLRNNMFELADRLVGIYKTSQRTKSVTIDPKTFCVGTFIKNGL